MFFRTPEEQANIELLKFYTASDEKGIQQPFANTLGIRHIASVVEDIEAVVAKLKKRGTEVFGEYKTMKKVMLRSWARGNYFRVGGANQINLGNLHRSKHFIEMC